MCSFLTRVPKTLAVATLVLSACGVAQAQYYLGSEIDLVVGFIVTKFAMIEAGYGHFFRGDYIKQTWSAIGSQDADWFYLQTLVRF